ncbi:MAG: hypothetical protein LBB26_03640 [Puniceicoccales bacterium]|jgi:hypothetical protein|nr:hypothetical protein [Puniceicoccales bacterium]
MKNTTIIDTTTADIFDDDWELQMCPIPGLTPGFKLESPFLWEFPAFLKRASPLTAAKAIQRISPTNKKLS